MGVGRTTAAPATRSCPSASSRSPASARSTASASAPAAAAGSRVDPLTFVETSSYGTLAVDAVIRVLGIDVVCHGSDRPYAAPPRLGASAPPPLHAIQTANPGRLLARLPQEVPA